MTSAVEEALYFACEGESLLGVVHRPQQLAGDTGVVLVVGGPQYRVGSHRQFVLLARHLAAAGIPVLRFDYRGMGDSSGTPRDFEAIAPDIGAAIDTLCARVDGVRRIVLWGLCDAATANAFYALGDTRVVGQIALNPWVRTVEGEAQAYLKHYYLRRVLSLDFWRKVLSLRFDAGSALGDFAGKLRASRGAGSRGQDVDHRPLPERLRDAQLRFGGATLVILSGQDLTAKEYQNRVEQSPEWTRWMNAAPVVTRRLVDADHTFSTRAWRDQVAVWSAEWILAL